MSIAPLVIWEMLAPPVKAPDRPTTVIPFPVDRRNPKKCRKARLSQVRLLGRCPGTIAQAQALLDECEACKACFTL